MTTKPHGGQAFPQSYVMGNAGGGGAGGGRAGMSLRDYLAAQALVGILSSFRDFSGHNTTETRVALAFEYADAMIAERAK